VLDHVPRGSLRAQERADQVDLEDLAEGAERQFEERVLVARAGVVDERVDATEGVDELVDRARGPGPSERSICRASARTPKVRASASVSSTFSSSECQVNPTS